ncbi:MAG: cytochrome c1 [Planctomycetaceae bacterium]|nr:cytochrome c1 [Planctomycetaceae bacterium]
MLRYGLAASSWSVLWIGWLLSSSLLAADPKPAEVLLVEPLVNYPVVAGFERFFAAAGDKAPKDLGSGGKLLLGELGCVACHQADGANTKQVTKKQAPILDGVGSRVRLSFIRAMLANPQKAKPGTTMPDVLAGLPENERGAAVEALTHFLATTGAPQEAMAEHSAVKTGEQHFHRFGCVACHMPRKAAGPVPKVAQALIDDDDDTQKKPVTQTFNPLGDLPAKYSLPSLAKFLQDPHAVRPSARMPGLSLNEKEAREIASYFFAGHKVSPNMQFAYFEGGWDDVPDFGAMKPVATGTVSGFDLAVGKRQNNFGMRFTGFLQIDKPGQYQFWIGSDDGSRLQIDGKEVVKNGGVHPHSEKEGRVSLDVGPHEIVVDYFQGGGEWTLTLDMQGQGIKRTSAAAFITITRERPKPVATDDGEKPFVIDPSQVEKGRKFFATLGCASCHQMKEDNKQLASDLKAKPLSKLGTSGGCLATETPRGLPYYKLTALQISAASAALSALSNAAEPTPAETVAHALLSFNCYACHERGKVGGVEPIRNAYFETQIPEMGDEGRVPPALDGVGDKLREEALTDLLQNGTKGDPKQKDRPYMHARMPKFHAGSLAKVFAAVDLKTEANLPAFDESLSKAKSAGRQLVGDKGLSCVKCHPFNEHAATGVQAINLNAMNRRLREDWFYRYLADPQVYRRGTRMPAAWPNGMAIIKDVLDANSPKQMQAVWAYLADGGSAAIPAGIVREAIVLTPDKEPILYRNFLQGPKSDGGNITAPRGFAVGYPEGVNLAFDFDRFALLWIWQGQFIDASKHWVGRGPGFQNPLGDNVLPLPAEVPLAVLADASTAWPSQPARDQGYQFKGYRFDEARRPIFQYTFGRVAIEDHPRPLKSGKDKKELSLDRTLALSVTPGDPVSLNNLFLRAVTAQKIEPGTDGWFTIDGTLKLRIVSSSSKQPLVRPAGNRFELLVPVEWKNGGTKIELKYVW